MRRRALVRIRTFVWRKLFNQLGPGSKVLGKLKVYRPQNISVGGKTTLNDSVLLNARASIRIGSYCHISPGVIINTGMLDLSILDFKLRDHSERPVTIEDGVWIASGVIINPGVTIGRGAVVGAGSVVTKDVEAFALMAGVPARQLRLLQQENGAGVSLIGQAAE